MSQPVVTAEETNNCAGNNNSNNNNSQDFSELPTTLEAALERIKELRSKRDTLLAQKEKSEKEVEKLTKRSRLAQIRSLVPRVLYRNSDDYENEINKIYSWKNISDEEIADIYQTKLRAIDLGKRTTP